MNKLHLMPLLALALVACAQNSPKSEGPGPGAMATGLAQQEQRITDTRVLGDRETIERLQQKLRVLSEAGIPQNNYSLSKAQCWLDTAKTQYHENDRTGYIEESLTESSRIIQALEADKGARAGYDTPLVARSTKLREDLWAQLASLKAQETALSCNARAVACAEVQLVRAGHAEQQTGWRGATPYVQMAEDGIRRAGIQAASCAQPPLQTALTSRAAPAPVAPPVAAPVTPPPVIQVVTKETFVLLADALFVFDKSNRTDILPGGVERLSVVVNRLKSYQSIQTVSVIGHTDRLGSDEYNDTLSASRAATVKEYMESLGIKAASVTARGVGKRDPVTKDCSARLSREQLIQCLQPDRRVTIEVTGVVK
jgi:outer membrane protein OmpA-like peptidoglycan-associated protein